jgi:cellulose 1,4-beta-cellobiosidase
MSTARAVRARAWRLRPLVPLATIIIVLSVVLPTARGAATCDQYGTTPVAGGRYIVQNNEWNSSSPQCVTVNRGTSWTVTGADQNAATNGPPAAYPSIFKGCHWGRCTTGSGLPIRVSALRSARSSWSTDTPSSGAQDTAYDIWFNTAPTTSGQPDGAELMIWLNSRGPVQPAGSMVATTTIDGATWHVWTQRMSSWNYVAYERASGTSAAGKLDIKAFTRDAVRRGAVTPSWYLIGVEAGFEIWQGGRGLTTHAFSFDATAGAGGSAGVGRRAPRDQSRPSRRAGSRPSAVRHGGVLKSAPDRGRRR